MDEKKKLITKVINRNRLGQLCVDPDFPGHAVYLHPVPKPLTSKVVYGEAWKGFYGIIRDTGKESADGKRIYVRYFIPVEKTTVQLALKDALE